MVNQEKLSILYRQDTGRRQKTWSIKRNCQCIGKTQDEDKQNINQEKLSILYRQDTGRRQTKHGQSRETVNIV